MTVVTWLCPEKTFILQLYTLETQQQASVQSSTWFPRQPTLSHCRITHLDFNTIFSENSLDDTRCKCWQLHDKDLIIYIIYLLLWWKL